MMLGVVNDLTEAQGGLATRAKFGEWPVAGKTGTSNGPKDFWFVGTTPLYTGAVWVGKQQGGFMPQSYYSGYVNGPIWRRMMELAHKGVTPKKFVEPPGIVYGGSPDPAFLPTVKMAMIDPNFRQSATSPGLPEAPAAPTYRETSFDPGISDPATVVVEIDRATGRLATEFTPPENVVQRRVEIAQLPGYAPPANPAPLPDETPDPEAVKQVQPTQARPVPNSGKPAGQAQEQKPAQP